MNMEQTEVTELQKEEQYLQEVISFADRRIEELQNKQVLLQEEINSQSKVLREEVTQLIRDFDDIVQLTMENAVLSRAQLQYTDASKEIRRLQKLKESPYFARIDYIDKEFDELNCAYIGAAGLSDAKTYQMYVCDWRAPVCELFYGFDTGDAWYETSHGRIDVELTGKRQYKIENGRIVGMYDSNSSLYDEILGDVLSGHTGPKLKVIVESIQKEQNRAIRFTKAPNVLIYGPAGSGKTSVGMHRMAYILYVQKDQLKSEDIVVLSNNKIFSTYIAGILPQLCEDDVSHMIFQELLDSLLPHRIVCQDFYNQYRELEYLTSDGNMQCEQSSGQNRRAQIALKYSREMLQHIDRYFKEYIFELPDIVFEGEVLLTAEELNLRMQRRALDYQGKNMGETYNQKLDFLIEIVKKTYENYFLEHQKQVQEAIARRLEEENGGPVEDSKVQVRSKWLRRQIVAETVDEIRERNQLDTYSHLVHILQEFAEKTCCAFPLDDAFREDWQYGSISFEDALLYAITGIYTGEVKTFPKVRHVLIDELQDYNPLQLYLVRLLYPQSAFTFLADSSQAVDSVLSVQNFSMLDEIWDMVSEEKIEKLLLEKSYRSSAPINKFAFRFLEKFDVDCFSKYSYFERPGKEPEVLTTQEPEAKLWEVAKALKEHQLVGIITADEEEAKELYDHCDKEQWQLISEPWEEISGKQVILPLILSKGLEFDAVILYRCMDRLRNTDSFERKMYLACTRALHELYLIDTDIKSI